MKNNTFMVRIGRRTLIDKKKIQKWIDWQSWKVFGVVLKLGPVPCMIIYGYGKNLKGKEIGKGIRQRKDRRYEARITIKDSGKPPFSIYGTTLQQMWKQWSMYLAEVLPGIPGFDSSMSVSKWYEKWMELYKVRNLKAATIRNYEEKCGKESWFCWWNEILGRGLNIWKKQETLKKKKKWVKSGSKRNIKHLQAA